MPRGGGSYITTPIWRTHAHTHHIQSESVRVYDGQKDRWTDRQTDRQTEQRYIYIYLYMDI